ncbi:MAG: hypothetical protein Q4C01_04475 [Clostridia bacterium]|nr:hypothetical protein [Clostridia bacterium]
MKLKNLLALLCIAALLLPVGTLGETEEPKITELFEYSGLVTLIGSGDLASYCFVSTEVPPASDAADWLPLEDNRVTVFKLDGAYTAFVMDSRGRISSGVPITVGTNFLYVIDAEGLEYPKQPLSEVLIEKGSSVDYINEIVAKNAALAGMYTRNAAVMAAVTLESELAKLGLTVPYLLGGSYQREDDWGVNPDWGKRLDRAVTSGSETFYHQGMHCVAILTWSLKQAGINVVNTATGSIIGKTGSIDYEGDNELALDRGQGGDIITTRTGHAFMILDRMDIDGDGYFDGYLTLEMVSPCMTLAVHSLYSIRNCTLYDMSATFSDSGRYKNSARYFEGSYLIPKDAWPDYMQAADEGAAQLRARERLLVGLGLDR